MSLHSCSVHLENLTKIWELGYLVNNDQPPYKTDIQSTSVNSNTQGTKKIV